MPTPRSKNWKRNMPSNEANWYRWVSFTAVKVLHLISENLPESAAGFRLPYSPRFIASIIWNSSLLGSLTSTNGRPFGLLLTT
jgi:hypothetical protein